MLKFVIIIWRAMTINSFGEFIDFLFLSRLKNFLLLIGID